MEFCGVCNHYHGEVCGFCGHHRIVPTTTTTTTTVEMTDAPSVLENPLLDASEILPNFLLLGSFNDAHVLIGYFRPQCMKAEKGASHILNAVPGWKYPFGLNGRFTYHFIEKGKFFSFDDAIQFLDQCEKDKGRVLVFCMTGNNRSAAIVIAYLMKCKGWTLGQSYQWVKERRASIDLSPDVNQQLKEYEQKIFGSAESSCLPMNDDVKGLVFPKNDDAVDHVSALSKLNIESSSDNAATSSCSEPSVAQQDARKDVTAQKNYPDKRAYGYNGRLCFLPDSFYLPPDKAEMNRKYPPVPRELPIRRKSKKV